MPNTSKNMTRNTTLLLLTLLLNVAPLKAEDNAMLQAMQEFQTCMASIDQSSLDKLQVEAKMLSIRVNELCRNGERDKAQEYAISQSKAIADSPVLKQLQGCGEKMRQAMPNMPLKNGAEQFSQLGLGKQHACDKQIR